MYIASEERSYGCPVFVATDARVVVKAVRLRRRAQDALGTVASEFVWAVALPDGLQKDAPLLVLGPVQSATPPIGEMADGSLRIEYLSSSDAQRQPFLRLPNVDRAAVSAPEEWAPATPPPPRRETLAGRLLS